jgi:hypothetical protein
MSRAAAPACLVVALALTACGGADPATTASPSATEPAAKESAEQLPKLPGGWRPYVNRRGGFALGLPRGWKPESDGPAVLIRSFDRLVALSIVPDRSAEGLAIPIADYATQASDGVGGFRGGLEPIGSFDFPHRYEGREVRATGTTEDGVEEDVSLIVLRRGGVVTFTSLLAANTKPAAGRSARLAERALATLRSRPPRG